MAVPGMKPKYEVRAKVRIGEKRNGYPSSVDHFLCDDPELAELFGDQPSVIRIRFPYPSADDSFSTGLEWWSKRKSDKKNQLACYTKDGGSNPVALRMEPYASETDTIVGPAKSGKDGKRLQIACPARDCAILKDGRCKPMGRLVFFLDGGRTDALLELDTKSWNSIETIEPILAAAGDLTQNAWELSVSFQTKGSNRFPVLSIKEAPLEVKTEQDLAVADILVPLAGKLDAPERELKRALASALDVTNPGWKDKPAIVERIKEIGPKAAAEGLLEKHDLLPKPEAA